MKNDNNIVTIAENIITPFIINLIVLFSIKSNGSVPIKYFIV